MVYFSVLLCILTHFFGNLQFHGYLFCWLIYANFSSVLLIYQDIEFYKTLMVHVLFFIVFKTKSVFLYVRKIMGFLNTNLEYSMESL